MVGIEEGWCGVRQVGGWRGGEGMGDGCVRGVGWDGMGWRGGVEGEGMGGKEVGG